MTAQENNPARVVLVSGGVGGARMARGLQQAVPPAALTVIVNVGDDEEVYGVHVSPDLDTVVYTMAGLEGPHGWGMAGDTFTVVDRLGELGADTRFRLGDRDLATNLARTEALRSGVPLSTITARISRACGVAATVLPVTDDLLRTKVRTAAGWLAFQDYFVLRGHRDAVLELRFEGADDAKAAPGVSEALQSADLVVIAPSNPPLSVWPMLAVPGIRETLAQARRVVAVSPLFGGKALKGPAEEVMATLGLAPGNRGVAEAYEGLITDLVVDTADAEDATAIPGLRVHFADTRIADPDAARRFASWLIGLA